MLFILHQVNCRDKFGCGFAGYLKRTFPKAEEAYHMYFRTEDYGDPHAERWFRHSDSLLGHYSEAEGDGFTVINIYAQDYYGNAYKTGQCYTNYKALDEALELFRHYHPDDTAICPQYMSCGLAGGDWSTVRIILAKYNIIPCDKIDLENRVYHIAK